MSVLNLCIVPVAAFSISACGAGNTTTGEEAQGATADQGVERATIEHETTDVAAQLRELYGDLGGELRYFDATTDLNGDGRAEIVAYVYGPMLCGTGGCDTLVLTPDASGYRQVTSISVSRPPIQVSSRSTNGWRNLLVHVSGGGIVEGYEAELRFDGTTYPSNPTVPPAKPAADIDGAEVLIPEFESFTDGKIVPLL